MWTQDHARGVALIDRLDAGMVYLNQADHADPYLPWGGFKGSGTGRSGGVLAYDDLSQAKAYHIRAAGTHLG